MWEKLKASFKNSVTILLARAQVATGLVLASVIALNTDPTFQAAVHTVLKPSFLPYYAIVIGLLTEMARRRTL